MFDRHSTGPMTHATRTGGYTCNAPPTSRSGQCQYKAEVIADYSNSVMMVPRFMVVALDCPNGWTHSKPEPTLGSNGNTSCVISVCSYGIGRSTLAQALLTRRSSMATCRTTTQFPLVPVSHAGLGGGGGGAGGASYGVYVHQVTGNPGYGAANTFVPSGAGGPGGKGGASPGLAGQNGSDGLSADTNL